VSRSGRHYCIKILVTYVQDFVAPQGDPRGYQSTPPWTWFALKALFTCCLTMQSFCRSAVCRMEEVLTSTPFERHRAHRELRVRQYMSPRSRLGHIVRCFRLTHPSTMVSLHTILGSREEGSQGCARVFHRYGYCSLGPGTFALPVASQSRLISGHC